MHIAVDARNIKAADKDEEQNTLTLLQKFLQSRPEYRFTIIINQGQPLETLTDTRIYTVENKIKNYLQLRLWHNKNLPGILKKIQADGLLIINGGAVQTILHQVIFLSSPGAASKPFAKTAFFFLFKKYLNKQLTKANVIATITGLQGQMMAKQLQLSAKQITNVGYATSNFFKQITWQQKEEFLSGSTNGNEYFLYTGRFNPEVFILLLKALSLFKKRQLSNMQLIIAGRFILNKELTEKLATYKYRADVKLYENLDEQLKPALYAASYAVIFLHENALTAYPVAAALQCGIPVIGLQNSFAVKELAGTAALYALATPESLAEQMKLLYKDEYLRKQLIANAAAQNQFVNGDVAVQNLWDCIQPAGAEIRLHLPPEKNESKQIDEAIN